MKDRSGYWKPKEPVLVYDYPLAPTRGDRPDAYDVVSKSVMDILSDRLAYFGDVIISLRVGDHDIIIRGEFTTDNGEPGYYVAHWDWWEGEEKVWINYIIFEDHFDEFMEGVECNG